MESSGSEADWDSPSDREDSILFDEESESGENDSEEEDDLGTTFSAILTAFILR